MGASHFTISKIFRKFHSEGGIESHNIIFYNKCLSFIDIKVFEYFLYQI